MDNRSLQSSTGVQTRVRIYLLPTKYTTGVEKPRSITKSEQNACGPYIPAEMNGGLKKCYLINKYNKEINAEIDCQGITDLPRDDVGNPRSYDKLSIMEKKDVLLVDNIENLAAELEAHEGINIQRR